MPKPKVVLDYQRCDPSCCDDGVCAAAQICERNVLRQEKPGELPDLYPSMCLGCTDCLTACPRDALRLMQ
ncbi:MAG: 4Fe-4S binding protein [Chloroflexi bacterium]|nr:4Fe-4S binding protein [Chloroflexota bacterium]